MAIALSSPLPAPISYFTASRTSSLVVLSSSGSLMDVSCSNCCRSRSRSHFLIVVRCSACRYLPSPFSAPAPRRCVGSLLWAGMLIMVRTLSLSGMFWTRRIPHKTIVDNALRFYTHTVSNGASQKRWTLPFPPPRPKVQLIVIELVDVVISAHLFEAPEFMGRSNDDVERSVVSALLTKKNAPFGDCSAPSQ